MDSVRKQAALAGPNVVALVRVCGNVFTLRRCGDALVVRKVASPRPAAPRASGNGRRG